MDSSEVVRRAIDAFNARRLPDLLALLCEDVEVWPLRPAGHSVYRGRHGVEQWLADLHRRGRDDRITIDRTRQAPGGRILAIGSVDIGIVNAAFMAVHELRHGLISHVHHYFSDETLLRRIGVID
ncbi:MAG TPA: nuclear transport factor 2 family protein [Solirubrobacteraceae bacterium]